MSRYGSKSLSSSLGVLGKHYMHLRRPLPLVCKEFTIHSVHIHLPMAKTTPDNLLSVERSILAIMARVLAALHHLEANPPADRALMEKELQEEMVHNLR